MTMIIKEQHNTLYLEVRFEAAFRTRRIVPQAKKDELFVFIQKRPEKKKNK